MRSSSACSCGCSAASPSCSTRWHLQPGFRVGGSCVVEQHVDMLLIGSAASVPTQACTLAAGGPLHELFTDPLALVPAQRAHRLSPHRDATHWKTGTM